MNISNIKTKRKLRTRKNIVAIKSRLRLSVFRSNKYMYAQIIDDSSGKAILGVSEIHLKDDKASKVNKVLRAKQLGVFIAEQAIGKKIKDVVFDRGGYAYKGRVKALAEGAREGGLNF